LNKYGIKDDEKFIYCSRNFNSYDAGIFLKNMQHRRSDFTAVIAGSDGMLIHLMRLLEAQDHPWRHTLAMIGFGNLHEAEHLSNMASFDQHPERIGIRAFEKLMDLRNSPETTRIIYEEIPMELVRIGNLPKSVHA
jgi:DNA-binding LacI/PurR family transcriptional regulator